MRQKVQSQDLVQVMLLALGAAMVLLPLVALADQKPLIQEKKIAAEQPVSSGAALAQEDFTKLGVSKVEAIFILRQMGTAQPEGEGL